MTTPRSRRTFGKLLAGLALASTAIAFTSHSPISVSAAAGDGLIDINTNQGQCNSAGSIDAFESSWNWTKPTLEYSTDNGTTWNSAGGSYPYGMTVCRDIRENQQPGRLYWFIIQKKDGNDDMGTNGLVPLFRATIPLKAGDATTRLTGYSEDLVRATLRLATQNARRNHGRKFKAAAATSIEPTETSLRW
jgi:hypothetical protein